MVRLVPTAELLHYHHRGLPILNWLLYSYGVPSLCFLIGAAVYGRSRAATAARVGKDLPDRQRARSAARGGRVLGCCSSSSLINLRSPMRSRRDRTRELAG